MGVTGNYVDTRQLVISFENGDVDAVSGTFGIGVSASSISLISAVPEPETYAMMLAGLGAIGFIARRRQRQ